VIARVSRTSAVLAAAFVGSLLTSTLAPAQRASSAPGARARNVVFILTDDQRYDAMHFHPNALNSDAILTYNQAFTPNGNWLVPTTVLTARTTKITVQWDF